MTAGPGAAQDRLLTRAELEQLHEPGMIGLLELPWIYQSNPDEPQTVSGYAQPAAESAVLAILDRQGVRTPAGDRVCGWVRDLDRQAGAPEGCEFLEAGYEVPAVPVSAAAGDDWYRIQIAGLSESFVWVRSRHRFHSLVELLAGGEHLTYLDLRRFDLWLHAEPGGSRTRLQHPAVAQGAREIPYELLAYVISEGRLWLHVRVLDQVCHAADPIEVARGWVAAKTTAGDPQAWYWSRGC